MNSNPSPVGYLDSAPLKTMESQGDKHMHILMTTFVPGTRRPLLHDPHPHWNYADSLKTVYANFPVLAKLLQSQGGYSPALGAAYEWLRDCESTTGGQQYFLAKAGWGAFQGGHRQDDLLDLYVQVRNEKEGLRTELDEVKKKHEAEAEVWKMEVDQTNRVKDEQVKERAKAEQQRDTLQRKLSESKSAIKRLGKTNSVDEEKLERARVADPQTLLDKGEGSHQGLQREGPQTRLKRKQDEERRERRREGSRRKEKIALRSSAEGAETRAQRKEAGNGNNESGTGRERNGTRAERNEAGNGPSANGEQVTNESG